MAWTKSTKNKITAHEIDRSISRIAQNVKYIIFEEGTFGLKHRLKTCLKLKSKTLVLNQKSGLRSN